MLFPPEIIETQMEYLASEYNLEVEKRNLQIDVSTYYLQVLLNKEAIKVAEEQLKSKYQYLLKDKVLGYYLQPLQQK